jgi:glycosyltransferase involved in cell wall biosynthesis
LHGALDHARFVQPGDDAALANEAISLIQNAGPRRESSELGKRRYAARYTPQIVAAAYDDLYSEIC